MHQFVHETKYAKTKLRLRRDFEQFLAKRSTSLPPLKTASCLADASPLDVVRFLHFRDRGGRTQVHAFDCAHFGASGVFPCGCPLHFAYGTVDSYIGMLRAIFRDMGRLGPSNPCDSCDVKSWLKACEKEQQRHRVPITQAKPTFSTHLRMFVMAAKLKMASLDPAGSFFPDRFLILRDLAFFLALWFSGDRAGDLGRALTKEVVRLEDGSLLFHHTVGKTIRSADGQLLVLPRVTDDTSLCPVAAFERYTEACLGASPPVPLREGFLFPPLAPCLSKIRKGPLSSSAATKRLAVYLPDEGLTAHGSRAGCAITLEMLGASPEAVREHCKWATAEVYRHYSKLERVCRLDTSSRLLQSGVSVCSGVSDADSAAHLYELLNSGLSQEPAVK